MTPEALRDYIVDKRFSEDIAQEVIVRYLRAKHPIRHPKAWAWKTCLRLKYKWARQWDSRNVSGIGLTLLKAQDAYSDPLQQAVVRQELARIMRAGTLDPSKRPPWGWNRHQRDYAALCAETSHGSGG